MKKGGFNSDARNLLVFGFGIIAFLTGFLLISIFVSAWFTKFVWNFLDLRIFHLHQLTYWQALGVNAAFGLLGLFFKGNKEQHE